MPYPVTLAAAFVLVVSIVISIVKVIGHYRLFTSATYFTVRRKALINAWRWLFMLIISILALIVVLVIS